MLSLFQKQKSIKIPVQDVPIGLPKKVLSLCPECRNHVEADILEENNKVIMRKKCKKHGLFEDIISTDVDLYVKAERCALQDAKGLCNYYKIFDCCIPIFSFILPTI